MDNVELNAWIKELKAFSKTANKLQIRNRIIAVNNRIDNLADRIQEAKLANKSKLVQELSKEKTALYKIRKTLEQAVYTAPEADYSKSGAAFAVQDVLLPVLGDAANAIGTTNQIKYSLLGQALANMSFNNTDPYARFGANLSDPAKVMGAVLASKGGMLGTLGGIINNRMQTIASTLSAEDEKRRNKQYQIDVNPAGAYWDQEGRLTRAAKV